MKSNHPKNSKLFPLAFQLCIGTLNGLAVGWSTLRYLHTANYPSILFALFFLFVAYFLSVALHESGHCLFGLLSGYRFLSFRLGNWILLKTASGFRFGRYNLHGTGGQCLMLPPETNSGDYPYRLYHAGGLLANLFFLLLTGLLYYWLPLSLFSLFCFYLAAWNAFALLLNGIPMEFEGLANDGKNLFSAQKDPIALQAMRIQLQTIRHLTEGNGFASLPEDFFALPSDADLRNPLIGTVAVLHCSNLLARHSFTQAAQQIQSLLATQSLSSFLSNQLRCELLYLQLLQGENGAAQQSYNADLKKYLQLYKHSLSTQRLLYTIAILLEKDMTKAAHALSAFEKIAVSYPYAGELQDERCFLQLAYEKALSPNLTNC